MSDDLNLRWAPPGPVAGKFMASQARVQILNGPVGSGKTTACCVKAIRIATRQPVAVGRTITAVSPDGSPRKYPVRRVKMTVVRDTYRQLWKTTLPSWWKRVPKEAGEWTGATDGPAVHQVPFVLSDNTCVDFIAEFIAIGEHAVEDVMRGYEPTFFYLNEADLLAQEVYDKARERMGRYPDMAEGGPGWYGILMDCNAPVLNSWFHKKFFLTRGEDVALFRQPSGFAADAENLSNLPPGYYAEQCKDQTEYQIDRKIRNKVIASRGGKPIYPEFDDNFHVADRELEPIAGLMLQIGFDAGLDPAAIITQRLSNGRWLVIDELVMPHGVGATRFGKALAQLLHERYAGWQRIRGFADPSASYGVDKEAGEQTWIDLVSHHAGVSIDAAPSNDQTSRKEALRRPLGLRLEGFPAFLLSPRCVMLRSGLGGGYRWRKIQLVGTDEERYTDEPEKNEYSHPCEALEYVLLGGGEDIEIHERRQRGQAAVHGQHVAEWDPLS